MWNGDMKLKLDHFHIPVFVFKQHVFFLDQNGASNIGQFAAIVLNLLTDH